MLTVATTTTTIWRILIDNFYLGMSAYELEARMEEDPNIHILNKW